MKIKRGLIWPTLGAQFCRSHPIRRFISHLALAGLPHQRLISPHWGQKSATLKFLYVYINTQIRIKLFKNLVWNN